MPFLQIDTPRQYSTEVKRDLAQRLGELYATMMDTDPKRVSVAIRELGEGGLWRCTDDAPYAATLMMCDIRRGRSAEQRSALGAALVETCMEKLGLPLNEINVEFSQHAGDEMYHPMMGGLSKDWSSDEGKH